MLGSWIAGQGMAYDIWGFMFGIWIVRLRYHLGWGNDPHHLRKKGGEFLLCVFIPFWEFAVGRKGGARGDL